MIDTLPAFHPVLFALLWIWTVIGFIIGLVIASALDSHPRCYPSTKQWLFLWFLTGPVGWVILLIWGVCAAIHATWERLA